MSLCTLEPFTQSLPINCNLIVYELATGTGEAVVTVRRGGVEMPVTATQVSSTHTSMDVYVSRQCFGETVSEYRPTGYNVVELSLTGVQVGDQLLVNGYGNGTIDAAAAVGACPLPYAPECNGTDAIDCSTYEPEPMPEDDSAGCHAGAGTSGLLVAVLLGLFVVRTRR